MEESEVKIDVTDMVMERLVAETVEILVKLHDPGSVSSALQQQ